MTRTVDDLPSAEWERKADFTVTIDVRLSSGSGTFKAIGRTYEVSEHRTARNVRVLGAPWSHLRPLISEFLGADRQAQQTIGCRDIAEVDRAVARQTVVRER